MKSDVAKIITLVLCWVTFSPIFLYLGNRWNMPEKWVRITLLFISPLAIVSYMLTLLFALIFIGHHNPGTFNLKEPLDIDFVDSERIERISGVYLDLGDIVEENIDEPSFNGDYSTDMKVILNSKPNFEHLDSLVRANKWMKYDGVYSFHVIWGNNLPAPPGEDENEDRMLSIRIPVNSDTITITTGMW